MKYLLLSLLFLLPFSFPSDSKAALSNSSEEQSLREIIRETERQTGYTFLYRESLISGISLQFNQDEAIGLEQLSSALEPYPIKLVIQHDRRVVIITERRQAQADPSELRITGQVVDAQTGERLPFTTVSWRESGQLRGVATGTSGRFDVRPRFTDLEPEITFSFVGYRTFTITFDRSELPIRDVTIRLEPASVRSDDIIVSGFSGSTPSDSLLAGMINASRFSPLGEASSIRALQSHPSVAAGPAFNSGMNVRGSNPDGFLVLLDGMTIFNQSHLFGLLDSFNPHAVQSSGYYFGVVPASMESPTGGTLNLITRTGSRAGFRGRAGLSNTSLNTTLEGPAGSRSSWMLSGRASYMNQLSWFRNDDFIRWGLDVDRPTGSADSSADFTSLVLRPGDSSAAFFDLHGKFYHETSSNSRFILSAYLGGDDTWSEAERRVRRPGTDTDNGFVFEPVRTTNLWGNALVSLQYEHLFESGLYSTTKTGLSSYESDFSKDDFVYTRIQQQSGSVSTTIFTYPFRNRSTMNELRFDQNLEFRVLANLDIAAGAGLRYYRGEYGESSFDRSDVFIEKDALLGTAFVHADWEPVSFLEISGGSRLYYFNEGNKILPAPRAAIKITPGSSFSLNAGYAVTRQFLHRISIANTATADVWILSDEKQKPASSEQFSAGFELSPVSWFYFKMDAYQKNYSNIRLHELNTRSLENTFSESPWFYNNSGDARGLEFILRTRQFNTVLTQNYTLSEAEFSNPDLSDGRPAPAPWDRTHSYNAVLEVPVMNSLTLWGSWLMMSGSPNPVYTPENEENERLNAYYRLDLSAKYHRNLSERSDLEVSFSVFNVLNHQNQWYRDYAFTFDETRNIPRLTPVPTDILDLGIHPSFSIAVSF